MSKNILQKTINNNKAFLVIRPVGEREVLYFNPDINGRDAEILSHTNDVLKFTSTSLSDLGTSDSQENTTKTVFETTKDEYSSSFNSALDSIRNNIISKVILSRIKSEKFDRSKLEDLFKTLCIDYPDALVYIYSTGHEVWLGASPELLSKLEDDKIECTSLAGTVSLDGAWSKKEQDEQQIVTDYIQDCIERNGELLNVSKPADKIAGSVKHLFSELSGKISDYPAFLEELHPTPAISGFPKDKALETIRSIESHDRELYTGYIRFSNKNKDLSYVNLRCLKHVKNTAYLYLGGGLTKDSVLETEWQETEMKASTLLRVMRKL